MPKIMLVDDAAFMRMMVKNALTKSGYDNIIEAQDGAEAVKKYDEENKQFADFVKNALRSKHYRDVLILGTEEFMYPAFCLGDFLLKGNRVEEVRVHATTRSPIIASGQVNYPLFSRYCIKSLYDDSRVTYVYNLREYEKVVIVTDALNRNSGVSDLLHALKSVGNRDIILTRWHYK